MPLENFIPNIDDRRYNDIMAEVRTRIARYTPEWAPNWTDLNDSDPGITMVQVFAWLADMMLYRMGKVPELNYLKFLQLLGIELNPAEPAFAEITFPVTDSFTGPYVTVRERTQVAATSTDGSAPVIFETERSLIALSARLKSVQAFDGYDYTDIHVENDQPGQSFDPFGPLARPGSALLLGFEYAGDFPQVELNLAVWVLNETSRPAWYSCDLPQTRAYAPARVAWEYWDGQEWQALSLLKDETLAFTQTGHIYLKTPAKKGAMAPAQIGAVSEKRYWIQCRLVESRYERPPHVFAIRTNTIAARQAETVRDEVLGGSNGRRDQVFQLANTPVLQNTLILEVDEGEGRQIWTRVDDFFGSSADDPHYVLDRTSGEVRFGNGINGRIPVANVENAGGNVVAKEYRFGGGKRGNVTAGRLQSLLTSIDGIDEQGVTNLQAAYGGRDEELLEQAKQRARQSIKSKCRAVTDEDFEYLAMQAANVKRAKALPLYHPSFPGVKVPGVVTVIVVPDSDELPPMPSDGTLRTVCDYLNVRRLLTTEVYVVKPTYQQVEIKAEVIAQNDADLATVKERIEHSLLTYFHPLKGGENGQGWPFGGDIYYSRVYQRVFTVPGAGVDRIEHLTIVVDGQEYGECVDVPISEGVLIYSTEHDIQVNYSFDE